MKRNTQTGIIAGIAFFVIGILVIMNISYDNQEIRLRNQVEAQQETTKANFDKMFKNIAQVAKIPQAAKESFKEMYEPLISGRYSMDQGGPLMKWITESNPQFDWSLYGKVQDVIESNRNEFFLEQKKLIDMKREHDNLRTIIPGKWFISADEIIITVITSTNTDNIYDAGKEDNINLY